MPGFNFSGFGNKFGGALDQFNSGGMTSFNGQAGLTDDDDDLMEPQYANGVNPQERGAMDLNPFPEIAQGNYNPFPGIREGFQDFGQQDAAQPGFRDARGDFNPFPEMAQGDYNPFPELRDALMGTGSDPLLSGPGAMTDPGSWKDAVGTVVEAAPEIAQDVFSYNWGEAAMEIKNLVDSLRGSGSMKWGFAGIDNPQFNQLQDMMKWSGKKFIPQTQHLYGNTMHGGSMI